MNLADYQRTLTALYLTERGRASLSSEEALKSFLHEEGFESAHQTMIALGLNRLQQYAHMIRYNALENLKATYPLTGQMLGERWEEVSNRYFLACPAHSHRLMENARPLIGFLKNEASVMSVYPYIAELARLEWDRADLYNTADCEALSYEPLVPASVQELNRWRPVINPVAKCLKVNYPVHQIHLSIGEVSLEPRSAYLWLYRHPEQLKVLTEELSSLLSLWLEDLLHSEESQAQSYLEMLEKLALQCGIPEQAQQDFYAEFLRALQSLIQKGILLGSVACNADC